MKILLVNPPRSPENKILEFAPEDAKQFIHRKLIGPPLGLLTIAAAVKDFDVTVIDLKGEYDLHPDGPCLYDLVLSYLVKYNPDIVGVTFIASEFYYGIEIFRAAKKFNPAILTVAGGLHVTICPEDFTDKSVDILCPGQSAGIFRDLVISHEKGISPEKTGGLIINTRNGHKTTKLPSPKWNAAGENFIMPDRSHLLPWLQTYKAGNDTKPATYIFTSLGCPYECNFCSIWPQYDRKYYVRKTESIIDELKQLGEYNAVRFADANTIVDVRFIGSLFERIKEEGIKKTFIMDIRFDTAVKYPGLIEKLAEGGLKVVICGFESFREEELKNYNKNSSARLIEEAIEVFHRNHIMLRGNYIVPNDYTDDDFRALADYAGSHKVVYAGYTILTPMPGTIFHKQVQDQIVDPDLSKYNFFNSVLKTRLPLEKFYENVGNLWKIKIGKDII
jgi:hopanoid C-3 methylase